LQVEGGGNLVQDLVEAALPEVCRLEEAAEGLDLHFADLLWIGDSPEEAVVLNGKGQVQLADPLFELTDRDDAGLRIQRVVE
jgi:hypothetical protein